MNNEKLVHLHPDHQLAGLDFQKTTLAELHQEFSKRYSIRMAQEIRDQQKAQDILSRKIQAELPPIFSQLVQMDSTLSMDVVARTTWTLANHDSHTLVPYAVRISCIPPIQDPAHAVRGAYVDFPLYVTVKVPGHEPIKNASAAWWIRRMESNQAEIRILKIDLVALELTQDGKTWVKRTGPAGYMDLVRNGENITNAQAEILISTLINLAKLASIMNQRPPALIQTVHTNGIKH